MYTKGNHYQQGKVWLIILIIFLILGLVGGGFFFMRQQQVAKQEAAQQAVKQEQARMQQEAISQAEDAAMMKEAEKELIIVRAEIEAIRPLLTEDGVKSLDLILLFVEENPTILITKTTSYPPEIVAAVNAVKSEMAENVAVGVEGSIDESLIGTVATLTGILVHEGDNTPFGTVYSLTDEVLDATFYFVPVDNDIAYQSLIDSDVQIDVQITQAGERGVLYELVSGPTAYASATPTVVVEEFVITPEATLPIAE